MDSEKIGEFIKELRTKKNLTQKELANRLHVTDRAVSKWERGKGIPDISLIEDIADVLDVSVIDILKGEIVEAKHDDEYIKETLKYANISNKNKIQKVIYIICSFLLLFVILNTCIDFSKHYYDINKKYYIDVSTKESDLQKIDNIDKSINLIKANKDKYSQDDYTIINEYLLKLEELLNNHDSIDYNWYYSNEYITVSSFFRVYYEENNIIYSGTVISPKLLKLLEDKNIINEQHYRSRVIEYQLYGSELDDVVEIRYFYNIPNIEIFNNDVSVIIKNYLDLEYDTIFDLIDYIKKLGDINEE